MNKHKLYAKARKLKAELKENQKRKNANSYPVEDNFNRRDVCRELKAERKILKEKLSNLNDEEYYFLLK